MGMEFGWDWSLYTLVSGWIIFAVSWVGNWGLVDIL